MSNRRWGDRPELPTVKDLIFGSIGMVALLFAGWFLFVGAYIGGSY